MLAEYADPDSCRYAKMVEEIRKIQNFTTLRFHRLDDLIASIGINPCKCVRIALTEKNDRKTAAESLQGSKRISKR